MGNRGPGRVVAILCGATAILISAGFVFVIATDSTRDPVRRFRRPADFQPGDSPILAQDAARETSTVRSGESASTTEFEDASTQPVRVDPAQERRRWTLVTGGLFSPDREVGKAWTAWPGEETAIDPDRKPGDVIGGGLPSFRKAKAQSDPEPDRSNGTLEAPVEPPSPSPERIREVSGWPDGTSDTLARLVAILRDPDESSPIKLIAILKLRAYPAEQTVPVLAEFLFAPAPSGGAYTKPTAVKALFDLGAEAMLTRLASESKDARVKLAIAALAKGGAK